MQIEHNQQINSFNTTNQDWQTDATTNKYSDLYTNSRIGFIHKVYSIVTIQLIITAIVSGIAMLNPNFLLFQLTHYGFFALNSIVILGIEITIVCCHAGRKHPINLILLGVFTLCESYVVSFFCSMYAQIYGGFIVVEALVLTAILVSGLTAFALLTKQDFTVYLGIAFVSGMCLFLFLLFSLISNNPILYDLYIMLGVFIFGVYLVIDTQLIMGGQRYQLTLDQHVVGAMFLYIDIISLFLRLLVLLGKLQERR